VNFYKLCKELQNFECVVAILIALQSASVGRLKQTWKAVLMDAKVNMVYNELSVLMSPDGNYAQYRTLIQHTSPPAIPYMGLYLRDLLFIDEGNKNFCDPARTMINFAKRKLVASVR
jgi:son of sevenless-like protein